jgi:hypothetical protein
MKKNKLFTTLVVLGAILLFNGCSKNNDSGGGKTDDNCNGLMIAYSNALNTYINVTNSENCEILYTAIQNYYGGCPFDDATKKQVDAVLATLPCGGN